MPTASPAPPTESGRRLLTYREAAAYLGPAFSSKWVKERVYAGELESIRLTERRTVIPQAELDRFVERRRKGAA